ncbi:unnamed protein product [Auanema sp. JU1783]|nr:unnamed protein product [Auanema sp. JU1783]
MDPNLVKLREVASLITESVEEFEYNLMNVIRESSPEVVILDDISVWERLGLSTTSVLKVVLEAMHTVNKGLVYVSSSLNNQTFKRLSLYADTSITLELIGGGFGKEVTGKLHISSKSCSLENQKTELLYLAGDRSIKCFYPGDASLA